MLRICQECAIFALPFCYPRWKSNISNKFQRIMANEKSIKEPIPVLTLFKYPFERPQFLSNSDFEIPKASISCINLSFASIAYLLKKLNLEQKSNNFVGALRYLF